MKTEPTQSETPRTDADFMRELLTDWRIPFDDHEAGRRIAVAQLIHDKECENQRLREQLKKSEQCLESPWQALMVQRDQWKACAQELARQLTISMTYYCTEETEATLAAFDKLNTP